MKRFKKVEASKLNDILEYNNSRRILNYLNSESSDEDIDFLVAGDEITFTPSSIIAEFSKEFALRLILPLLYNEEMKAWVSNENGEKIHTHIPYDIIYKYTRLYLSGELTEEETLLYGELLKDINLYEEVEELDCELSLIHGHLPVIDMDSIIKNIDINIQDTMDMLTILDKDDLYNMHTFTSSEKSLDGILFRSNPDVVKINTMLYDCAGLIVDHLWLYAIYKDIRLLSAIPFMVRTQIHLIRDLLLVLRIDYLRYIKMGLITDPKIVVGVVDMDDSDNINKIILANDWSDMLRGTKLGDCFDAFEKIGITSGRRDSSNMISNTKYLNDVFNAVGQIVYDESEDVNILRARDLLDSVESGDTALTLMSVSEIKN